MNKLLFIIILSFISINAYAENFKIYEDMLKKCDLEMSQKMDDDSQNFKTSYQIQSTYELMECYQEVSDQIINKYFTKNKSEVKNNIKKLKKALYSVNSDIYMGHDKCPYYCGSLDNVKYNAITAYYFKNIIKDIITELRLKYK